MERGLGGRLSARLTAGPAYLFHDGGRAAGLEGSAVLAGSTPSAASVVGKLGGGLFRHGGGGRIGFVALGIGVRLAER